MKDIIIHTDNESGKGRSFRAVLLSYVTSTALWDMGGGDNLRPVWAMIACSPGESIPFVRNLQCGRKAAIIPDRSRKGTDHLEFLKTGDYAYKPQTSAEGTVWSIYLPDVFLLDPGIVDPERVRFAVLPSAEWVSDVDETLARELAAGYSKDIERSRWNTSWADEESARRLDVCRLVTRIAPLFCKSLDTRTRCPLIPDPRFYAMVLAGMLSKGLATLSHENRAYRSEWGRSGCSFAEYDTDTVGLLPGLACSAKHDQLEALLSECVSTYERGGATVEMQEAA